MPVPVHCPWKQCELSDTPQLLTIKNRCRICSEPLVEAHEHEVLFRKINQQFVSSILGALQLQPVRRRPARAGSNKLGLFRAENELLLESSLAAASMELPLDSLGKELSDHLALTTRSKLTQNFILSRVAELAQAEAEAHPCPIELRFVGNTRRSASGSFIGRLEILNKRRSTLVNCLIHARVDQAGVSFDKKKKTEKTRTVLRLLGKQTDDFDIKLDIESPGPKQVDFKVEIPEVDNGYIRQEPGYYQTSVLFDARLEGNRTQVFNLNAGEIYGASIRQAQEVRQASDDGEDSDDTSIILPLEVDLDGWFDQIGLIGLDDKDDPASPLRSAHLLVDSPSGKRVVFLFLDSKLSIGRAADNHIVTRYDGSFGAVKGDNRWKAVSRWQAKLEWQKNAARIRDPESRYRTRVIKGRKYQNLTKTKECRLFDGNRIRVPATSRKDWQYPYTLEYRQYVDLAGAPLCMTFQPEASCHPSFKTKDCYRYVWLPDDECKSQVLFGESGEVPVTLPDLGSDQSFRIVRKNNGLFVVPCSGVDLEIDDDGEESFLVPPNTAQALHPGMTIILGETTLEFHEHQSMDDDYPKLGEEYPLPGPSNAGDCFKVPEGFAEILLPLCSRLKRVGAGTQRIEILPKTK